MKMQLIIESLETRRLFSTNILADFGGIYPTQSVTVNGVSFFAANDGTHGTELWKSDGTIAGTVMGKDLTPGSGSTEFDGMYAVGNRLLFFTPDPNHRNTFALWSSDGTAAGTHSSLPCRRRCAVTSAAVLGDELVFTVASGFSSTDQASLWTSDGTVAGTQPVFQFPTDPDRWPQFHLTAVGTHVVMSEGDALWTTDGTAQGTVDLTNVPSMLSNPGLQKFDDVQFPVVYDNEMYFANEQAEVWKTDGTAAGTQLVLPAVGDIDITAMKEVGGKIYFSNLATDQYHDEVDLYITDGTEQGTYILASFKTMNAIADVGQIGNDMVFGVTNPGTTEVWITDGTIAGTKPLHVEQANWNAPGIFRSVDGIVFFASYDAAHGEELWRTDGTSAGTMLVQDITPGPDSTQFFNEMAVADGKLIVHTGKHPLVFDPATMLPGVGPTEQAMHMDGSVLRIFGTRDDDSIHLYDVTNDPSRFIVELNGVKRSFAFSDVSRIYVYSYSGNDTVEVKDQLGAFTARCAIWTGDGDDTVETGDGRDTIYGEAGDDYISGGNNNDVLWGGDGEDSLIAGNGNDTVSGGDGADDIEGNKGNDIISGGDDNSQDTINGGAGGNVLFGQAVYDTFFSNKPDAGIPVDNVLES